MTAIQAPTGGNSQGWRWLIVTDADKRQALAELYREIATPYLKAGLGDAGEVTAQQGRVIDSATYLSEHLHEVPVHVIPCLHGELDALPNFAAAGSYGSIIPAMWSFQLALRSRGLGSVLTTLHLPLAERAAELLEIPSGVTQIGLIPVAYFTGDDFKPATRLPASQVTHWDSW